MLLVPLTPSIEALYLAYHLLGRIHEARDDRKAMIDAWQEVRTLDAKAEPGPVAMSEDEIERLVDEADIRSISAVQDIPR